MSAPQWVIALMAAIFFAAMVAGMKSSGRAMWVYRDDDPNGFGCIVGFYITWAIGFSVLALTSLIW